MYWFTCIDSDVSIQINMCVSVSLSLLIRIQLVFTHRESNRDLSWIFADAPDLTKYDCVMLNMKLDNKTCQSFIVTPEEWWSTTIPDFCLCARPGDVQFFPKIVKKWKTQIWWYFAGLIASNRSKQARGSQKP